MLTVFASLTTSPGALSNQATKSSTDRPTPGSGASSQSVEATAGSKRK